MHEQMPQEKNEKFVETIFLKNANKGQIVVWTLGKTSCYLPNKNELYVVIPNSETNSIHNIQYFTH